MHLVCRRGALRRISWYQRHCADNETLTTRAAGDMVKMWRSVLHGGSQRHIRGVWWRRYLFAISA